MLRVRHIAIDNCVHSFPLSDLIAKAQKRLRDSGQDSSQVETWSRAELIEYAKTQCTPEDFKALDHRCMSVKDYEWPESWQEEVYTDPLEAWKRSPFIFYDDPSYR